MATKGSANPATTAEQRSSRDLRARALRYALDCHAKKNAAGVLMSGGQDAKKGSLNHEDRAETSLPR